MKLMLIMAAVAMLAFGIACEKAPAPKTTNAPVASNSASPASATTDTHGDDAPRITLADAKKDFDAGNVVFVDTRAEVQFKSERVKGSINVPMEAFEARWQSIPKDKKIIAYCS